MPTIQLSAAREVLETNRDLLHSLPGVWGSGIARVGRGYRVRLLVHSKPGRDPHTPHLAIPTRLEGVPVDHEVVPESPSLLALTGRQRPVQPGWSVGRERWFTGTIGLIVKRATTTSAPFPFSIPWHLPHFWPFPPVPRPVLPGSPDRYILSNMHVLGGINHGQVGDPIYQPGPLDAPPSPATHVGTLADFVPFQSGANDYDCALARLDDPSNATGDIPQIGRPTRAADSVIGMKVEKTGRTTEHTTGNVYMKHVSFGISTGVGRGLFFRDMDLLRLPHWPGDSGSAVCTREGNVTVTALLFAGVRYTTYAFACPIERIMSRLGIALA